MTVVIFAVSFTFLLIIGRSYTVKREINPEITAGDIDISFDREDIVALEGFNINDGIISIGFRSLNPGKVYVSVSGINDISLYVHPIGIITENTYYGGCSCSEIIPLMFLLFGVITIIYLIGKYRADNAESVYQYKNAVTVGILVFSVFFVINQIIALFSDSGFANQAKTLLEMPQIFLMYTFPVILIISVLIIISNIILIRKEGMNTRNMLGFFLGVSVCVMVFFPYVLGEYLQRSTLIDVHNENGAALYIELFVEGIVSVFTAYFVCVLTGTVYMASKAARLVPDFDRDYILILGCKVGRNGKVTKLLGSRAEKAAQFARMQKEKTGKNIVFVPSGGKGSDELVSEAKAISDYLIGSGFNESEILQEDKSVSTEENFRLSMEKIRSVSDKENPGIAFSTSNYHVFRAGMIAFEQGIDAQGIGAPTKRYFWINASIREFVATVFSEKKRHIVMLLTLTLIILYIVLIVYFNNNF